MARRKTTYETYQYESIIHMTSRAVLFESNGIRYWIPKSVVEYDNDTFTVPSWFELTEADDFEIQNTQENKSNSNRPFKGLFNL